MSHTHAGSNITVMSGFSGPRDTKALSRRRPSIFSVFTTATLSFACARRSS